MQAFIFSCGFPLLMASLKPRGAGYHKEQLDAKFSIFIYVLCSLFCYSTRVLSIIDTLVCYNRSVNCVEILVFREQFLFILFLLARISSHQSGRTR